jgi:hypothetical protein
VRGDAGLGAGLRKISTGPPRTVCTGIESLHRPEQSVIENPADHVDDVVHGIRCAVPTGSRQGWRRVPRGITPSGTDFDADEHVVSCET